MASIEELKARFDSLVKTREELTSKKVAAESRYQVAQEQYTRALEDLKEKFGVESLDQAKALYEKKKSELETTLNKCEMELGEVT